MKPLQHIKLLGVPFSFGQPKLGVKEAPAALRSHGLLQRLKRYTSVIDLGDLDFSLCEDKFIETTIKQERPAALATELISQCLEFEELESSFLLNVGGDHGLSLGTIHGLLTHSPDTVVVWADAHGDINTPIISPSGNFHGMPLAFLLSLVPGSEAFAWVKQVLSPRKLIMMGPRDLDDGEKKIIQDLSIQYYSSQEINFFGAERLLTSALIKADPEGSAPIHLSFDMDIFDSHDIHSTGTRVNHGPKFSEVFSMGRYLGRTGRLRSMDLVELNPEIGDEDEVTESIYLALDFIDAVMGEVFSLETEHLPFYPHAIAEESARI